MADVLPILGPSAQSSKKDWHVIQGFTGHFDGATVESLRSCPSVEYVEEDMVANTFSTQTYTPWGLERITSTSSLIGGNASALAYTYEYEESAGSGVDIYIVDTGINVNHSQFCGRAKWGMTFGEGNPNIDDNGHGTHVSGTAAGNTFGVAKKANLIAVKVLHANGSGPYSDILDGLDYVYQQVQITKRPSVVSMSLGGPSSFIMDSVVTGLTKAGIHVVAAAGNNHTDLDETSPARAEGVIAVGAVNITDERAYYSNYGERLALFAPGSNIISSLNTDELAIKVASGTSMACPHVSGMVAYLLSLEQEYSPKEMKERLQELAIKGALKDIPDGTPNLLAQLPRREEPEN